MTYSASNSGVTLKSGLRGRSRSLKMAPIDRSHMTLYWFVNVARPIAYLAPFLSRLTLNISMNLKSRLGVIEGHWKWH